ncbi:MAG: hypoxanthine phosphoribosyltransferase [Marinilabiliales bacterium]|nr:MAG: hypoxanthine phosphoribosyltransferase [Marinilabiliales bacterium]
MEKIRLHDKEFTIFLSPAKIQDAVSEMAAKINNDLAGKNPLFLGILNGSFMFTADLLKKIDIDCSVSFIKLASYCGDRTTGTVKELIGLDEDLDGRSVVILEDIVDTGTTLQSLVARLWKMKPLEVRIATLLLKPGAFSGGVHLDYVGLEIPNDFIVGYGLDYDQLGRNFEGIYKVLPDGDTGCNHGNSGD